ncbi:MAG TPA: DUF58 domain-containing protein, partial [Steroidobacteraceae bacterium]|nr:DUF58 domain-containing protein [Steroidobacteraceae bacterium]
MSLRQNGLLLVLLAALIAIAGDWGGDASLERWWRAPLGLLLLGLAYEAAISRRAQLQLQLNAAVRWLLCRATPMRFELESRLPRRLAVELAVNGPADLAMERSVRVLELSAEGIGSLSVSATARRLGPFEWPKLRARQGGVLGLAWWNTTLSPSFRLQVVPDLLRAAERALDATAGGARAAARAGAGGEILQLRDYRTGDAPRAIDWKATARARRL